MLNVGLVGDRAVIAQLDSMPDTVRVALRQKIRALALRLQTHIQRDKLSGQVLNVVTGALRRSIHNTVTEDKYSVTGRVMSSGDVKYARIHEFGGKTRAHDIYPRKADALSFMMGGRRVFAKVVHHPGSQIPERSFMRTGLADMSAEIVRGMKEAIITGLMQAQAAH